MNEWYAQDSSRKIQAIFKSRMEKGLRCSGSIPYGYLRDPQDKQHLIVDEEPAAIVRRIFQMVIEGYGVMAIADALTADKIMIPSAYAKCNCSENNHCNSFHEGTRGGSSPAHGELSNSPRLSVPSGRGEPYQPKEQMRKKAQEQAAKQAAQKKAAGQRAMQRASQQRISQQIPNSRRHKSGSFPSRPSRP